jgi:hypothetical protein
LSGRSPQEAALNAPESFKAILGCITSEGFVSRYERSRHDMRMADFQDKFAILDRRNGQTLKLELYQRYAVVNAEGDRGPWTTTTTEYIYEVFDQTDDLIAAWHWHPMSGRVGDEAHWPHLHAYGARETLTLHKLHLPTGRVSLEAVVRFLIEDLDVVPRRADWSAVLTRHEDTFRRLRNWA